MAIGRTAREPVDVIIVDADPRQRRELAGAITDRATGRFLPHVYATPAEAIAARSVEGAIVIADVETIGGVGALSGMSRARSALIATSSGASVTLAVAAVKAGAIDFLAKPIGAKALIDKLDSALATWKAQHPAASPAPAAISGSTDFAGFVGRSPVMLGIYEQIRRMAPSKAPVFITGESGTGKELAAEAIHSQSAGNRPFVAINCSAIPRELMESEIFGHVRGAFTGASDNRPGAAEMAENGTLFLDEIAEMDLSLQAKLLRFVQTGTLRRVGGTELKKVNVRIVSATNRDPFVEVDAGRFRADLFYRLHVLPLHLPPLRERPEDITLLAETFLKRFSGEENTHFQRFSREAATALALYAWPGNVRQLENAIRRLVVLHDGEEVTPAMLKLPGSDLSEPSVISREINGEIEPFLVQERRIIETALAVHGGSISKAAAALDIAPSTIYRKRQEWERRGS